VNASSQAKLVLVNGIENYEPKDPFTGASAQGPLGFDDFSLDWLTIA
jgi:hypothetical protein